MSALVIQRVVKEAGSGGAVRWDHLHGLLLSAVYGGRVDNGFDMRVLETFVEQARTRRFFCLFLFF